MQTIQDRHTIIPYESYNISLCNWNLSFHGRFLVSSRDSVVLINKDFKMLGVRFLRPNYRGNRIFRCRPPQVYFPSLNRFMDKTQPLQSLQLKILLKGCFPVTYDLLWTAAGLKFLFIPCLCQILVCQILINRGSEIGVASWHATFLLIRGLNMQVLR